jgi:hypothetical protein
MSKECDGEQTQAKQHQHNRAHVMQCQDKQAWPPTSLTAQLGKDKAKQPQRIPV